jgi:hypothetical protein
MSTVLMHREIFADGWRFTTAKYDCHTVDFANLSQSFVFAGIDRPLAHIHCRDQSVAVNLRSKHEAIRIHVSLLRHDSQLRKHEDHITILARYARFLKETEQATGGDIDEENIETIFGGRRRNPATIIHMIKTNLIRIIKSLFQLVMRRFNKIGIL